MTIPLSSATWRGSGRRQINWTRAFLQTLPRCMSHWQKPHWIRPASGDHGKFMLLPPPPPLNRDGFWRPRKISATTPPHPTESGRLLEITENFCYYYPPPPPLNRDGFWRSRNISATTPPSQSVVVPLLDYPLRIRPWGGQGRGGEGRGGEGSVDKVSEIHNKHEQFTHVQFRQDGNAACESSKCASP